VGVAVCLLVGVGIAVAVLFKGRGQAKPQVQAPVVQTAPATPPAADTGQMPVPADQTNPAVAGVPGASAPGANPPVAPGDGAKADAAKTGTPAGANAGAPQAAGANSTAAQTAGAKGNTEQTAPRPVAKTKPLDPAEKARIDALKALGEYKEDKKK
jgi:hypothetical protein